MLPIQPSSRPAKQPRWRGIALLLCLLVGGASVAAQTPPAPSNGAGEAWQRQQPTRDRTQDLMRREGVAESQAERRQELRSLNEIHRELMPPGTTVPAPGLTPRRDVDAARAGGD